MGYPFSHTHMAKTERQIQNLFFCPIFENFNKKIITMISYNPENKLNISPH